MKPTLRSSESESGVILVIVACVIVVLIGMLAIAIDGGYGFVQNRRAQNAADFAAFAAAQQLNNTSYCHGVAALSTQQIATIIQHLVDDNDPSIGTAWSAQYLESNGTTIGTLKPGQTTGNIPPGACGVTVTATPTWPPFFAQIFGVHQWQGHAAGSVGPTAAQGPPIGIVALNKVGPHEILGGGTGNFVVSGDIFLNTDVTHQPWSGSAVDPTTLNSWQWDDAIDAKTDSNLYVYGTIHSNNSAPSGQPLWPLDQCFEPNILGDGNPGVANPAYQSGDPSAVGSQLPAQQMSCSEWGGSVTIDFDNIDPTVGQIDDPLLATGAPPSPMSSTTNIACPGMNLRTYSTTPQPSGGTTILLPGEYTNPVDITGSAQFLDCSGYPGEAAYPGIYRFDQGLWINPQLPTDTVTGSNIVIATAMPYPMAGNTPGSVNSQGVFVSSGAGNGAPCLPAGTMTSAPSGHGTPEAETSSTACSGTSNPTTYGVTAYGDSSYVPDSSMTGTGSNFSLIIGGASGAKVTLTGPTTGAYGGTNNTPGLVLYQDPNVAQDPNLQANYGFDAESGDAADIVIKGVVYNASLSNYGANAPLDYWDGIGGGIPIYAGGTLQTGFGAGWGSAGPPESGGSVTITGIAIVDDFNTDGATTITIVGQPYSLPGANHLSFIG
jgi:hypothetical protein